MKISYIKEGYFKDVTVRQKDTRSGVDKVVSAARELINKVASERFNTEFKEYITGVNGIFTNANRSSCDNISYHFAGNTLYCEITVGFGISGQSINSGNVKLEISYPENIVEIEKSLSEEYHCDAKVIMHLHSTYDPYAACMFTDGASHNNKIIMLRSTDDTDLTNFCHLLNCCEDFNYEKEYQLYIGNIEDGKDIELVDTDEPLKKKFQTVALAGFDISQITGLDKILSNEVSSDYHKTKPFNRGWGVNAEDVPNYTGILLFYDDEYKAMSYKSKYKLENVEDLVDSWNEWAKEFATPFKHLFAKVNIDSAYEPAKTGIRGNAITYKSDLAEDIRNSDNIHDDAENISMQLTFRNDFTGVFLFRERKYKEEEFENI